MLFKTQLCVYLLCFQLPSSPTHPLTLTSPLSEFIDPDFAKISPKRSFSVIIENERCEACFRENWVYKFGHLLSLSLVG